MRHTLSGVALAAVVAFAAPSWAQAPMSPTGSQGGASGSNAAPAPSTNAAPAPSTPSTAATTQSTAGTTQSTPPTSAPPTAKAGPMQMTRPGASAASPAAVSTTNGAPTQTATAQRPKRPMHRQAHYTTRRYYGSGGYAEPDSDFVANQLNAQQLGRDNGGGMPYGPGPGYAPPMGGQQGDMRGGYPQGGDMQGGYPPPPGNMQAGYPPPPYGYGGPPMGYPPPPPWAYRPY